MKRAVVSLHDVMPAHEEALRVILARLAEQGVTSTSLLVIPDYHRSECAGAFDLTRHPRFAAWLRALVGRGHEVVLHGLEHCDPTPHAGTVWQRIVRRVATVEAEFYTLSYDEARERIARGLNILGRVGLEPRGFVAPGWLHNEAVIRAIGMAGLRYVTSLGGVRDLARNMTLPSRAICFSARSPLRAHVTTAYCGALARYVQRDSLMRIAIHPGDLTRPGIVARLDAILRNVRTTHDFMTYRALLGGL